MKDRDHQDIQRPGRPEANPSTPRRNHGPLVLLHSKHLIIGGSLYEHSFSFRVVYSSIFGAFIDSVDGVDDNPTDWTLLDVVC